MAYAVSNNSVLAVTIQGYLFGQQVMTTLHYVQTGGIIADGAAYIAGFDSWFAANVYTEWLECIALDVVDIEIKYQWITLDRYRPIVFVPTVTVGQNTACETPNTACVLSLTADLATRRSIGNKHLPGLPSAAMLNGLVAVGQRAKMESFGEACKIPVSAGANTLSPIIYGRSRAAFTKCGRDYPALPESKRPVTGYLVNPNVRVMRRRTVGLGS